MGLSLAQIKVNLYRALISESWNGHVDNVKLLLSIGASVNEQYHEGLHSTALGAAASVPYLDCIKVLLEAGADVNLPSFSRTSPLMMAAYTGDIESVQVLLGAGAKINARGEDCETPLGFAAQAGKHCMISYLVQRGANIDGDKWGTPPLVDAARFAHMSAIRVLLSLGASIDATDRKGRTALHRVYEVDAAKTLLEHGANVEATDNQGWTPLFAAADRNVKEVAELLLAHGANPSVQDKNGRHAWLKDNETCRLVERAHRVKRARRRCKGIVRFLIVASRYREEFYLDKYIAVGARSFSKKRRMLEHYETRRKRIA